MGNKMRELPEYCRECGSKLKIGSVDADKIKVWFHDSMGGTLCRLDSPFDEKTGGRNEAETRTCPNWKPVFSFRTFIFGGGSNSHDKIIIYENDLHWL